MSRNYKFHNPDGVYFVSFAVVEWLDVWLLFILALCAQVLMLSVAPQVPTKRTNRPKEAHEHLRQ
ncbi:hypothetical protein [Owenweeksia hongkongensis]|uniref:hypothetical protein n=1 Tax=Owenweeksia hongkongensis TaxID=253245 RepID=UPI003A8F4D88